MFDSKLEANFAKQLDILKHAQGKDKIASWDYHPFKIEFRVNGQLITSYTPDFFVRYADGRKELVETKGFITPDAKIKLKWLQAEWLPNHPEIEFVLARS